jgi:uncharacterized SAM-binding protein YcdF (DUF218 family)
MSVLLQGDPLILKRRILNTIVGLFAALGLLVFAVTVLPINAWLAHKLSGGIEEPSGEVLVVLSGGRFADGLVSENSLLRSYYAVRAVKQRNFHTVIISGGGDPPFIAESMREVLIIKGVPADLVTVETASLSTRESALNLKIILDKLPGDKVLLTSDYHMFRARRAFEKAGIKVLPNPVPDVIKRSGSWRNRWPAFVDLCVEATKIGYYYLRGWI